MLCTMCMGSWVLQPGSAAQFSSQRMLCSKRTFAILSVIALVKIFLHVSSRVMGLVLFMLFSHAVVLGMGYMLPLLHSVGVECVISILLNRSHICCIPLVPNFLNAIYGMPDGPGAEVAFREYMMLRISSVVNGVRVF